MKVGGVLQCVPCHDIACASCSGNQEGSCTRCKSLGFFQEDGVCHPCHETCEECTGPGIEDCKSCKSTFRAGKVDVQLDNGHRLSLKFLDIMVEADSNLVLTQHTCCDSRRSLQMCRNRR
jgi:hypothetical protein